MEVNEKLIEWIGEEIDLLEETSTDVLVARAHCVISECTMQTNAKDHIRALIDRVVKLQSEVEEYELIFSLQDKAISKAEKMWQDEHERHDVLPDLTNLVEWLIGRKQSECK